MRYDYLLLSDLLRSKRLERNYSIRGLARAVDISDTELARIENGERKNINLITLIKLCEVLNIDFVRLLKVTGYYPHTYSYVSVNPVANQVRKVAISHTKQNKNVHCNRCEYYCPVCKVCVIKEDK